MDRPREEKEIGGEDRKRRTIAATERGSPRRSACFALSPDSYETAVANAVFLGGDTDTIAAMTAALAGAYLGVGAIPHHLLEMLEDQAKGRTYIADLADKLYSAYASQRP